jgi:hypothetical protein
VAKGFIDQAIACRRAESGHAGAVIAFNKLDEHRFSSAGQLSEAVLHVDRHVERIRRAAGRLSPEWRMLARGWSGVSDLQERWEEERSRFPSEAPALEDLAALVALLRDDAQPDALNEAVRLGLLSQRDAERIASYSVQWPDEEPLERVRQQLRPMGEALSAFIREARLVLHPSEVEGAAP